MNTTNTPILLSQELSAEEIKLQNAEETRNYKNKKEKLDIRDRLDLRNTTLYGEKVAETLNATKSISQQTRALKKDTQYALFDSLTTENNAQAA